MSWVVLVFVIDYVGFKLVLLCLQFFLTVFGPGSWTFLPNFFKQVEHPSAVQREKMMWRSGAPRALQTTARQASDINCIHPRV